MRITHLKYIAAALLIAAAGAARAEIITLSALLSGAAEAPPNASPGTGSSTVTIDTTVPTMRVQVSFSGLLGNTTVAHIHCCTAVALAGTVGVATPTPTFPGFPAGVTAGSYDQTFDMLLLSSYNAAFVTNNGGTAASAWTSFLAGLLGGNAYVNVHSSQFPGGEIRGFLVPEPASLVLVALGLAAVGATRRRREAA